MKQQQTTHPRPSCAGTGCHIEKKSHASWKDSCYGSCSSDPCSYHYSCFYSCSNSDCGSGYPLTWTVTVTSTADETPSAASHTSLQC